MNKQFSTLALNDVVDGKIILVRGIRFDAEFNAVFTKKPGLGLEIDSQEMGPISVIIDNEYFLLDQEQLKCGRRSLYNEIITAFEVEALKQAAMIPDYKWEVLEFAA